MNKTDKLWVAMLVAVLVGTLGWQYFRPKSANTPAPVVASTVPTTPVVPPAVVSPKPVEIVPASQRFHILKNGQMRLTFSDLGARLVKAELLEYRAANTKDAPHMVLDTGNLLGLSFSAGAPLFPYRVERKDESHLVFSAVLPGDVTLERDVTLGEDYVVSVKDTFLSVQGATIAPYRFDAGSFSLPEEKGDTLGADTLAQEASKPEYHESKLGKILGARSAFLGCGTSSDPIGLPLTGTATFAAPQTWVALKSRFFVTLVMPPVAAPAGLSVARDPTAKSLRVNGVSAEFRYPALQLQAGVRSTVTTRLYVGPKKLSDLSAFGAHADRVMDFGFFSWFCGPLLWILNFFYAIIPNYGVAIILLTLLVRVVFWPLTHKSTISMRKMSIIQPQIKELQQKFKDQPQKIQQETFRLYREHKVNPFSSCLPMLIQIPIFIALFTVLRSAVELRFAPFLWIADLSQPENLLAGFLPVPLNILPILTAVTMALQTHLSPSTGDPAQKKMMTWMMPIMLLFMFYSMPSALCLYWTVSQTLSILQMWHIQRVTAKEQAVVKV